MIAENKVKKYCCEDFSLIENYDNAVKDTTQTWHCHHRLETELGLSQKDLIKRNLFVNRPASELIFLTETEHKRLHTSQRVGDKNPMYGKSLTDEHKQKLSKSLKGKKNPKISLIMKETQKGEGNYFYGHHQSDKAKEAISKAFKGRKFINKNGIRKFVKSEDVQKYIDDGWSLGRRLK